jgi:hypothetical protein
VRSLKARFKQLPIDEETAEIDILEKGALSQ